MINRGGFDILSAVDVKTKKNKGPQKVVVVSNVVKPVVSPLQQSRLEASFSLLARVLVQLWAVNFKVFTFGVN